MAKTFTHVGVATYKGKTKFRFTNGRADARVKTMTKEGFENIEFVALDRVMTKAEALKTAQAADISARYGIPIPTQAEAEAEQPIAEAA
jgi:hypothetical protein